LFYDAVKSLYFVWRAGAIFLWILRGLQMNNEYKFGKVPLIRSPSRLPQSGLSSEVVLKARPKYNNINRLEPPKR